MHLSILTLDKTIFSGTAKKFHFRDENGELEILPHHQTMLAIITPCTIRWQPADGKPASPELQRGGQAAYTVQRGVVDVKDNTVTVLIA